MAFIKETEEMMPMSEKLNFERFKKFEHLIKYYFSFY
jgi:hypothetical protein